LCKFFYVTFDKDLNLEFTQFYQINNNLYDSKFDFILEIINLKKTSGFMKRENKFNSSVLYKLNLLKLNIYQNSLNFDKLHYDYLLEDFNFNNINYYNNFFKNYNFYKYNDLSNLELTIDSKNIDIKSNLFSIYKNNRNNLAFFLQKNFLRQIKFNKFVKNFIKLSYTRILYYIEFKLMNVLVKSNYFSNYKDAYFFIKNGFVLVNNKVNFNINYLVKIGEIIKIVFDKYYYLYYRERLNDIIVNVSKFNSYI